jgi:diguanylate cyclase (GGDEF)-like protein
MAAVLGSVSIAAILCAALAPHLFETRSASLLFVWILACLLLLAALLLRRQRAALEQAQVAVAAVGEISAAFQTAAREDNLSPELTITGGAEIRQMVASFHALMAKLRERDQARLEAEARLQHMALVDDITGLPNRRLLSDRLSQCLAKARREQRMVALLHMDLDGFKLVNDSLGLDIGDELLNQVAQRLKSRFRQSDTLARIGGDEFTLILDNIQGTGDAQVAAEGVREALNPAFEIGEHSIRIGASIGISVFPEHGLEAGQLMQQADCAMYAAKRNGRNRIVQFGDDLGKGARERLTLEGELRRAIADGEIAVHYQPEFDLSRNRIVRFEALARWTHPKMGAIPPLNFIPVAEECGLIIPLGAYVMEQACRDAVTWQQEAGRPIQVAVNVSSVQFARDVFVNEVEEILERTGLHPTLLQIELTESAALGGVERAAHTMRLLKSVGISVAMDDFGTGYSSLSYLPRLSFDALKIDRSFVNELMVRRETRAFVQSILTMAHNLQMKVIVEGIETPQQLELTRRLGANEAQGYLLGRPSPDPLQYLRRQESLEELEQPVSDDQVEEVPQP